MTQTTPAGTPAPATRSTAVLHLVPPDAAHLVRLVIPAVVAEGTAGLTGLRTLLLTTDADLAVAVARAAARELAGGGGASPIVALTSAARARRVFAAHAPLAVAIPVSQAAALIAQSALPLGEVRHVFVALPSALDDPSLTDALGGILAEVPRSATRILVTARETPAIEQLVERHFFKARRIRDASADAGPAPPSRGEVRLLAATPGTRWDVLRRLLDQLDPPSAAIVAPDAATFGECHAELATLGYGTGGSVVTTRGELEYGTQLVVLMGIPDAVALRSAMGADPATLVVLCAPNELGDARSALGGVPTRALTLDGSGARALQQDARTRARLREILASGEYARELGGIAPLLDEYDGAEVAAAAVVLASETARATAVSSAAERAPVAPRPREAAPARDHERGRDRDRERPRERREFSPKPGARPRSDSPRSGGRGGSGNDRRPPRGDRRG